MARRKIFKEENLETYVINMKGRIVCHGKIKPFPPMISVTKENGNSIEFAISTHRLAELFGNDFSSYEICCIMRYGLANLKSITVKAEKIPTNGVKFISEIIDHETAN